MDIPSIGSMAMALASVFIIPCLNAWNKEHKLKKASKIPGLRRWDYGIACQAKEKGGRFV